MQRRRSAGVFMYTNWGKLIIALPLILAASACDRGPDPFLEALKRDAAASLVLEGATLESTSEREYSSGLVKATQAALFLDYRVDPDADPLAVQERAVEAAIAAGWDLDVDEDGSGWGEKELATGRAELSIALSPEEADLLRLNLIHHEAPPP